jgi:putative glutamine amidotransferase
VKPLIAIAGRRIAPAGVVGWPHAGAVAVAEPYLSAVQRAGGQEAVVYPELLDDSGAAALVARFDGLLLLGGSDVEPGRYGADPNPSTKPGDPIQDDYEIRVVLAALEADKPVLAICRGIQVLNVALGGTLVQHLPDVAGVGQHTVLGASEAGGRHDHVVQLEAESRIAKIMGTRQPVCPSSHHQAVDALGKGLVAVGWADDGVVEAVEHEQGWVVGVQWHPESSAGRDPAQQALFDALVRSAVGA